jgi:hypothetical protein
VSSSQQAGAAAASASSALLDGPPRTARCCNICTLTPYTVLLQQPGASCTPAAALQRAQSMRCVALIYLTLCTCGALHCCPPQHDEAVLIKYPRPCSKTMPVCRHMAEATALTPKELTEGLTASTYETKTRGQRQQGPARAAGEGSYVIAKGGSKGGAHLGYVLELPGQPGQAQQVLGIKQQGSFVLRWVVNMRQATAGLGSSLLRCIMAAAPAGCLLCASAAAASMQRQPNALCSDVVIQCHWPAAASVKHPLHASECCVLRVTCAAAAAAAAAVPRTQRRRAVQACPQRALSPPTLSSSVRSLLAAPGLGWRTAACWTWQALSCCWWAQRTTQSAQVRGGR